jgi:hypothetical protein
MAENKPIAGKTAYGKEKLGGNGTLDFDPAGAAAILRQRTGAEP